MLFIAETYLAIAGLYNIRTTFSQVHAPFLRSRLPLSRLSVFFSSFWEPSDCMFNAFMLYTRGSIRPSVRGENAAAFFIPLPVVKINRREREKEQHFCSHPKKGSAENMPPLQLVWPAFGTRDRKLLPEIGHITRYVAVFISLQCSQI